MSSPKNAASGSTTKRATPKQKTRRPSKTTATLESVSAPQTERVSIDSAGRLVVPAKFRKAIGLRPGDPVTVTLENNVLRITTTHDALSAARALMREKNPTGKSLVKELIAERRAESARE